MFSKISRYRKLPDVVTTDEKGRTLESKSLRLFQRVSGTFLHTIEEVDRLDHLAYKYYKQPRKWWRICDANPVYMSPQSLLGKDSIKTTLFPVEWEGSLPPWSGLLNGVSEMVGVENATVGTPNVPFADMQIFDGTLLFAIDAGLTADLDTGVRTQELSTPLRQALEDNGMNFIHGAAFSFVEAYRWKISDLMNNKVYTLKLEEGALNVYEGLNGTLLFDIEANSTADLEKGVQEQELSTLLRQALEDNGFMLGTDLVFSVDHNWRITDLITRQVYTFKLEVCALNIYKSLTRHTWVLIVFHNEMNVISQAVANRISMLGFIVGQPQPVGRLGKQTIIPPNTVG